MKKAVKNYIKNSIDYLYKISNMLFVGIITTTKSDIIDLSEDFKEARFLDDMIEAFISAGIKYKFFFDEKEFIAFHQSGKFANLIYKYKIMILRGTIGKGVYRKSLGPCYCDQYNIPYIASNGYISALCRQKFHYTKILEACNIPVPKSYCYDAKKNIWLNEKPELGMNVIVKPTQESDSIGITNDNILIYSELAIKKIHEISAELDQPVLVQKFIKGYEVTVPIIISSNYTIPLSPIGFSYKNNIKIGDHIQSENQNRKDYSMFNFSSFFPDISKSIENISSEVIKIIEANAFARIDFRIDENLSFFVNDINTSPGINKFSAFAFALKSVGISNEKIPLVFLSIGCINASFESKNIPML